MPNPFHIAFPVDDLAAAREFYGGLLECPEVEAAIPGSTMTSTDIRS